MLSPLRRTARHCWNAGNELLQLKNSAGSYPSAGPLPKEAPGRCFGPPEQSAAADSQRINACQKLCRVLGNCHTLTCIGLIELYHDGKAHGLGCRHRRGAVNCTARRNANPNFCRKLEKICPAADCIIA